MDNTALFNISYGVFMLATKYRNETNGCITNTCMQVASNPTRIAISCINTNFTCELIKKSKAFNLSILDSTCTFDTIKHFGMQSGRNVNKFENYEVNYTSNKIPYLKEQACSLLCCNVVDEKDLGSHTLFIAEIDDAIKLSSNSPLTYSDYQTKLKPKPQVYETKRIKAWRCKICGFIYENPILPTDYICPTCGHPASDFEPIYE